MAFSERANKIAQCKALRAEGFSFGEIASKLRLPKSVAHWHARNIELSPSQKRTIAKKRQDLCRAHPNRRKGRCVAGRNVHKPVLWNEELVHVIAHLIFDGSIEKCGCVYYNSSEINAVHMSGLLKRVFGVEPKIKARENGVYAVSAYYVELADYAREKEKELLEYIRIAPKNETITFLRAFFDDEGSVYYKDGKRRIRGSQDSIQILGLVKALLTDLGISSRIDVTAKAVEISGRKELAHFKDLIGFSEGIFVNPERKNSIWKQKLEKMDILNRALDSYIC